MYAFLSALCTQGLRTSEELTSSKVQLNTFIWKTVGRDFASISIMELTFLDGTGYWIAKSYEQMRRSQTRKIGQIHLATPASMIA